MRMDPIDSFEIPELGYRFVDFQNASLDDRREALGVFREQLQGIISARQEPVSVPTSCDIDSQLGAKNFLVYEGDEIRGAFNIYNVDEDGGFAASAVPGVKPAPGLTVGETWGIIMSWMLESIVDVWVFQSDVNEFVSEIGGLDLADVVLEISASGHTVTLGEDGTPERAVRAI